MLPIAARLERLTREAWYTVVAVGLWLNVVMPLSAREPSVVIEHCAVFDPESGEMLPDRTIVIRGRRSPRWPRPVRRSTCRRMRRASTAAASSRCPA